MPSVLSFKKYESGMNIFIKNFSEISKITPFLIAFLSFVVTYFFPLLYPELSDITASNLWPTVIIMFTTLIASWFMILLPGLVMLVMIYLLKILDKSFLPKNFDEQLRLKNRCFTLPLFMFCLDIAIFECYLLLSGKAFILLFVMLCLINALIAYYFISKKLFQRYVTYKIFFREKGIVLLSILFMFYFTLGASVTILSIFIKKIVPPILKNSAFNDCLNLILTLTMFLLPSELLLIGYAHRPNNSKAWVMNSVLTVIVIFFIYTDWYTPILKPKLKKHHYAFFNDINYYFGPNECAVLKENKVLLKQLNKKLCAILEDFETTSAIGNNLILTFNNNKRITLPKPKYYVQSVKT